MNKLNRRQFNTMVGASAASLAIPLRSGAQAKSRVVVIGGGAAGATAARYIARGAGDAIDVTLVSASDTYTSCFFSNLYLGDFRSFESITHSYDTLASRHGINVVIAYATEVDRAAKQIKLEDGSHIPYDRLVVASGIDLDYDSVPGYSAEAAEIAPHAWQAGPQTQLLKTRLDALENGQDIVVVPPTNPYRCPPGPYERVSMMAHVLKTRGLTDSKILVIDPKPNFSKQGLFQEGWDQNYGDMIEWYGPDVHGGIVNVDAAAGAVETDLDVFEGGLLNIIPAQKAGVIAAAAGLTNDTGFCPIDASTMRSTLDDNVFVVGDASIAGAMPKSAFSANSQAKVAAAAVLGDLTDSAVLPATYSNTCWSLIATNDAVKVGAQYEPVDGKIASTSTFISATGEDPDLRKATYQESIAWYEGITIDMFG